MNRLLTFFMLLLASQSALTDEGLPDYQPTQTVSGTLRIWGHGAFNQRLDFVEGLVGAWEAGFQEFQPGVRFDNRLFGTASAIGALYTGQGDLALMGREIWPPEIEAFREVFGYPPTGVNVMTGSFDVRNKGYAIVVFVNRDNPLKGLRLAQLDAIYGVARRRGHAEVQTWGDLGLTGRWAHRPVHLYGLPIARGFAKFMEDRVFLGSHLWKPSLKEFPDDPHSVSTDTDGATRMLAALANDPDGIGYAGLVYHNPGVRAVPLAETEGQAPVMPAKATVADHSYPLKRMISMFYNLPPDQRAPATVVEFLNFILSRQGQEIVRDRGEGYLPLQANDVRKQRLILAAGVQTPDLPPHTTPTPETP